MAHRLLRALISAVVAAALLSATPWADAGAPVVVRGVVMDHGGRRLAGISVSAIDWSVRGGRGLGEAVTDEDGRYRLTYPADDRIVDHIVVSSYGFARESRYVGGLPGRTYTVDLALRRLPFVSGKVVNGAGERISGAQVDVLNTVPGGDCPGGVVIAGDTLDCVDYSTEGLGTASGRFELPIHAGTLFSLVARAPGYRTRAVHDVRPGEYTVIALEPGDGAVAPVTVTGVVTDSSGATVGGAEVVAADPDTSREDSEGGSDVLARATTDAAGAYSLTFAPWDLDNLEHAIVVRVETERGIVAWPVGEIGVGRYYEPGSTLTVDIALGPSGTLAGEVRDADGNLMTGTAVCCGIDGAGTVTDDEGRYTLEVLPGFGHVRAGSSPLSRTEYVAAAGATTVVDIRFRRPPLMEPKPPPPEPDVTRPAPPQEVRVTARHPRRARVAFEAAYDGGRAIEGYQAACVRRDGVVRNAPGESSPVVVGGLSPGRWYRCRVRAENALGWGSWSAFSSAFRTPVL